MSSVRRSCVDLVLQAPPHAAIDGGKRLVEQQHRRIARQRAGQRDALALAARELVRAAVARARDRWTSASSCSARARRSARGRCPSAVMTLPAAVRCGNSAYSWKTKPTRRRCGGTKTPRPCRSRSRRPSERRPVPGR